MVEKNLYSLNIYHIYRPDYHRDLCELSDNLETAQSTLETTWQHAKSSQNTLATA